MTGPIESRWEARLKLYPRGSVQVGVHGVEDLRRVKALNERGEFVLLGCNHIEPANALYRVLDLFDDMRICRFVLDSFSLESVPMISVDPNVSMGTLVGRSSYFVLRNIKRLLVRVSLGKCIFLRMNLFAPRSTVSRNVTEVRAALDSLRQKNIILFPYGHCYPPGSQKFEIGTALPDRDFCKLSEVSQSSRHLREWRHSIKPGIFWLAQRQKSEIVPIYLDCCQRYRSWNLFIGHRIAVELGGDCRASANSRLQAAITFVEEMARLQVMAKVRRSADFK